MAILIINRSEVRDLLPMNECMDVMAEALKALSRADGIMPLRQVMWLPQQVGALAMMPAYVGDLNVMGVKVVSLFPGNEGTPYELHAGAIMLFEVDYGQLLAIVDANEITALRTAATTGVATRLLAREDAADLAILGSGVQARNHLEAMLLVRPIRRVRVWSRVKKHAQAFAENESRQRGVLIEAMGDVQAAVEAADIICTTTAAPEPILLGEWISDGTHINAIGSSIPSTRELDTAAVVKSRLFVDRRESTLHEAGDFLFPKKERAIGDDHILGEIGEILLGKMKGRKSTDEVTLFKSSGLAVEDVASAQHIYRKAVAKGTGKYVELAETREGRA